MIDIFFSLRKSHIVALWVRNQFRSAQSSKIWISNYCEDVVGTTNALYIRLARRYLTSWVEIGCCCCCPVECPNDNFINKISISKLNYVTCAELTLRMLSWQSVWILILFVYMCTDVCKHIYMHVYLCMHAYTTTWLRQSDVCVYIMHIFLYT